MLELLPNPSIIAHRGASKYAPENTIAAFSLAAQQGADGVELDAKLTKEGEVVVIHDASVDRTTNGVGLVRNKTLEELQTLDAGSWFDEKYAGETIPTLAEVFEVIAPRMMINIELTNYYGNPLDILPYKVALLIKEYNVQKRVWVSSFNLVNLWRFARLLPDIPIGILVLPGLNIGGLRKVFHNLIPHSAIHPHEKDVDPHLIQQKQEEGKKIFTWTVNDPARIEELISLNINGIITDDPVTALEIRRQMGTE